MQVISRCLECGAGSVADLEDGQPVTCGNCGHSWVYASPRRHQPLPPTIHSGIAMLCGAVVFLALFGLFLVWVTRDQPAPIAEAEAKTEEQFYPAPRIRRPPAPKAGIPDYAVSSGRTVLAKLEQEDWVKWTLWGGINEPPTLCAYITHRQWKMLSERELILLGYLAKSRVSEAMANPQAFGGISPLAPLYPKFAAMVSRMNETSWSIRLVNSNGTIGVEVASGESEPWVSNGPVPPMKGAVFPLSDSVEPKLREADDVVTFRGVLLRAEGGSTNAMLELAKLYRTGTGTETNDFEARVWEIRAGK